MTDYMSISIGPIGKTLGLARKTRELWGASFFFSYLMKEIILALKKKGSRFILPRITHATPFGPTEGMGTFPDRLIFEAGPGDFDRFKAEIITPILADLSRKMAETLDKEAKTIQAFLEAWLRIVFCQITSDQPPRRVCTQLNRHLDILELQDTYIPREATNHLMTFMDHVNSSFLTQEAFGRNHSFDSIPEIAARSPLAKVPDLKGPALEKELEEDTLYQTLKTKLPSGQLRPGHKYIAIVQADGDNLGKAIHAPDQEPNFDLLSRALADFTATAGDLIREWGGTPVYIGGDDLLFFAPLIFQETSVFHLCQKLSKAFTDSLTPILGSPAPTLSFGLSISYYKFPLFEAHAAAGELLDLAKKQYGKQKNNLAFRLLKHSGRYFQGTIPQSGEIFPLLIRLCDAPPESRMLTSIIHNTMAHRPLIQAVARDPARLQALFDNFYNEDIHREDKTWFTDIVDLIQAVFAQDQIPDKKKLPLVHSVLLLIQQMKGYHDHG